MLNYSNIDKEFIKKNFTNSEELLKADNPKFVLRNIYELIEDKGFISQDEGYNDFGREAQKVYDSIYLNN